VCVIAGCPCLSSCDTYFVVVKSEDVEAWGQHIIKKGVEVPIGIFCMADLEDALEAFPNEDTDSIITKYQDAPEMKEILQAWQTLKGACSQNPNLRVDFPRSDVGTLVRTVIRVERKGVIADDSDFQSKAKMSAKNLAGVAVMNIGNEEGGDATLDVFRDDGSEEAKGLRKCTLFRTLKCTNAKLCWGDQNSSVPGRGPIATRNFLRTRC
jgi:hypothetical protein